MPVRAKVLQRLLNQVKYDRDKTDELVDGFTNGFDIGYRGKTSRQDRSHNLPLRVGSKTELWTEIMKEVKVG